MVLNTYNFSIQDAEVEGSLQYVGNTAQQIGEAYGLLRDSVSENRYPLLVFSSQTRMYT